MLFLPPCSYCRGVHAIVYMVDAAAPDKMDSAKAELHALLQKDQLAGIPVLVLGNKNDLPNALEVRRILHGARSSSHILPSLLLA